MSDVYKRQESKQPEKEKKMTDLEVPADFDWKGSQNAKVKIASQSTATISVLSLIHICGRSNAVQNLPGRSKDQEQSECDVRVA